MASGLGQRISIIVIAVVMIGGTLGFYFITIANNGQNTQANPQQDQQAKLLKQFQDQQKQQNDQTIARQKTLKPLDGYAAAPFDAASVTALQTTDLVVGTGATASASSKIKANYFGWTPDGKIFDSTVTTTSPATPVEFSLSGVIKGWTDGIPGMKVGGIRKLIIPADQAYGAAGSPPLIPANTPLIFIVQLTTVE